MFNTPLIIVLGPTASGKTNLAVKLAKNFNGEIISADSRQIFRGMDMGTGKDLGSYNVDGESIPYHLIDILDAGQSYNVSAFQNDFWLAYDQILERQKLPILCGGTGMYIHSLLQNHHLTQIPIDLKLREALLPLEKSALLSKLLSYPEALRQHADTSSHKRLVRAIEIAAYLQDYGQPTAQNPSLNPLVLGLNPELVERKDKILKRLDFRLANGLIEEVEDLLAKGVAAETLIFYGLEYKFVVGYLNTEMSFEALREKLGIAICQYAKRQMTFFRKMEKDGIKINWLDHGRENEEALMLIAAYLK